MSAIIEQFLTVGITTKNRSVDLNKTLLTLEGSELRDCPIIIIDDGSVTPVINPEQYKLNIQFIRYDESKGLIPRRNELARLCKTKYLMSLDDDSAPVTGSIAVALAVFDKNPLVKTVALHIVPPGYDPNKVPKEDYESRYFIGCGHIHEVATFLKLGGYSEHLIYDYEETEYSLKLAQYEYVIIHKSDYHVVHNRSSINRNISNDRQYLTNRGWVNWTYLGFIPNIIEFYSLIKNHGIRNSANVIPLYMSGLKSVTTRHPIRLYNYIAWKARKTPTLA